MSNQTSHPLVEPGEYERNKDTIANYRAYLDMYERMNEQGIKNHEEMERLERALEDKVRAGEEAKRALELLQNTRAVPRLTDGRSQPSGVGPLVPVAPLIIPTVQAPSNSAYIEELPNQEPAKPSPVAPAAYTPYATNRLNTSQTQNVAQPSYHNAQQQQFNHNSMPHAGAQQNTQTERSRYTTTTFSPAPQSQQQSTQYNTLQQNPYYRSTTFQSLPYTNHPQQAQPHSSAQTRQTFPHPQVQQAQADQYQRYIAHQEQLRLAALGHQTSHSTSRQGQYNRPPPNQVQTPNLQSKVTTFQAQSSGQRQPNVPQQNTSTFQAPGQMPSGRNPIEVPKQPVPQKQVVPAQPTALPNTANRVNLVNQVRTSSLDGALGSSAVAQLSGSVASGPSPIVMPIGQPIVTPSVPEKVTVAPAERSQPITPQLQVPPTAPTTNGAAPPAAPVAASGILPKSPPTKVPHSTLSPLRTPSQADKKHLARDLLRALKRPRLENSPPSTLEPQPKRHAPEPVVKGVSKPSSVALSTQTPLAVASDPVTSSALPTQQPWQVQQAAYQPVAPVIQPTRPPQGLSGAVQQPSATINDKAPLKWAPTSALTPIQQNQPLITNFRYTPTPSTTDIMPYVESLQQSRPTRAPNGDLSGAQGLVAKATSPNAVDTSAPTVLVAPPAPSSVNAPAAIAVVAVGASKPIAGSAGLSSNVMNQATASSSTPTTVVAAGTPKPATGSAGLNPNVTNQVTAFSGTPTTVVAADAPKPIAGSAGPSSNITNQATTSSSTPTTVVVAGTPKPIAGPAGPSSNVTNQATASSSTPTAVVAPAGKHSEPSKVDEPKVVISQKTPLFLPSPTSSPASERNVVPSESISQLSIDTGGKGKGKAKATVSPSPSRTAKKSSSSLIFEHVMVPPLPDYVKRWKSQQKNRGHGEEVAIAESDLPPESRSLSPSLSQFRAGSSSRSSSVPAIPVGLVDLVEDEGLGGTKEESSAIRMDFSSYDPAERDVLHEYCTRLRESFCRWQDCDVVLNTPGALLQHLDMMHRPRETSIESPWTCRWAGCGYTVISAEEYRQHIQKHAVFPLWCPYTNCTESFRTPRQLIRHKRNDHDSNAVLRSTAQPMAVSGQSLELIPRIPKILPSYMTEYRVVRPASMNRLRHEVIMAAVRRRISGNVAAQLQGYNAARPMPTTPSGTLMAPSLNTPYSFLEHRSTRYSSYLSSPAKSKIGKDLDSTYVTNLVEKGLVLWPDKESDEAVSDAMIQELDGVGEGERELEGEGHDVFGPTIATTSVGDGAMIRDPSDEETVELMLMQASRE